MEPFLFYILSGAMLFFGLLVITSKHPVHSSFFLILVFFFMAGLFVLLHAFFLAAVQVLVYAGAVMVLFLFVIMLLNLKQESARRMNLVGIVACILIISSLILEFTQLLRQERGALNVTPSDFSGTTEVVGRLLFTRYLIPFELASLLLLMAMVGVIMLSRKDRSS